MLPAEGVLRLSFAPTVPTALAGTVKSATEIDLSWTASTDATAVAGYRVYRDGTLIATVGSTSWFDTALAAGSTHTYEVSAVDAAGNESARTAAVSKTTTSVAPTDTVAPTTPAGVTAVSSAPNAVTLTWSASADTIGVTSYTISRNGTPVSCVSGTAVSFTDYTIAPSTAYTYTLTASDAAGNTSAPSMAASLTTPSAIPTDSVKPTVPADLVATAAITRINLTWTASTDNTAVAGYKISRDGALIGTSYSPSYSDIGLVAGVPHTYTVAAFDGDGNTSDPSTTATASAYAPPPPSVAYTYDLADHLMAITTVSGSATTFTIDTIGRHATRTVGTAPTEAYSYLGSSATVVAIASSLTTTTSAIDAVGSRVATAAGGSCGFLLPDLHGNTAGALNSAATAVTDAFAYDAYGNTVASVTSALPTPWRFQGRILESAAGTPDLYDFGARSYSPTLGAFTSLDTVSGSAQNPVTLNRYLYAGANPASLVDPDGHCWGICIDFNPVGFVQSAASTVVGAASAVVPVVASVAATVAVTVITSTPVGTVAFVAASTVAGAAGAAASDIASGNFPDVEHVAAGAVSGATYAAVYSVTKNWTAAGAASGAAGDAFTQTWDIVAGSRSGYDLGELATSTLIGAGTGYVGGRISSRFGPRDDNVKVASDRPGQSKLPDVTSRAIDPAGYEGRQLKLWADEPYDRDFYDRTPTARQKQLAGPGMEWDHNPPTVQHYYEGDGPGTLAGFNMTQGERVAYGARLDRGAPELPSVQRAQGGTFSNYSRWTKKQYGSLFK